MGLKRIILELDFQRVAELIPEKIENLCEAVRTRIEQCRKAVQAAIEAVATAIEAVATAIEEYRVVTRDNWRGWNETDIESLAQKIDDELAYHGGLLRLTDREYRALPELNRRVAAAKRDTRTSPIIVWVEDRGLFTAIRKH